MRYISIDIETTGLDPDTCQILEIGAVIENSKDPKSFEESEKFQCIINRDFIQGQPYALNLNANLIELLKKRIKAKDKDAFDEKHNIVPDEEVAVLKFANWINSKYQAPFKGVAFPYNILVAGKNFDNFDRQFLEKLPLWHTYIKPFRRILDPCTLYTDWQKDVIPPDLKQCKKRAGLEDIDVSHNAVEDAWDVIQVLRKKY